jgi:hypothetical protein
MEIALSLVAFFALVVAWVVLPTNEAETETAPATAPATSPTKA